MVCEAIEEAILVKLFDPNGVYSVEKIENEVLSGVESDASGDLMNGNLYSKIRFLFGSQVVEDEDESEEPVEEM